MKIAILPGDGIGPEIVGQAQRVLAALRADGLPIETESAPMGGAGYDAAGDPLPAATLALARAADAILLGAVGGPRYDALPRAQKPEQGLLRIRKELGLFANLRPALPAPVAVLARIVTRPARCEGTWIAAPDEPARYAHDLYANLRALDATRAATIVVEAVPDDPAWQAVRDRLLRATRGDADDRD